MFWLDEGQAMPAEWFADAEAGQDTLYTPAAWKLGNPGLIYQFGEFLIELLAYYVRLCPDIAELFYIPASGLARFYDRVARNHADQLAAMRLVRIHHPDLEESGYVGYAKQA